MVLYPDAMDSLEGDNEGCQTSICQLKTEIGHRETVSFYGTRVIRSLRHSLSVLEQVCSNEVIIGQIGCLAEWSNALNSNLDLSKRVAMEIETPKAVGRKVWEKLLTAITTHDKVPESLPELLGILGESLNSEVVAALLSSSLELKSTLSANVALAEAVQGDFRSGMYLGSELWSKLVRFLKEQYSTLQDFGSPDDSEIQSSSDISKISSSHAEVSALIIDPAFATGSVRGLLKCDVCQDVFSTLSELMRHTSCHVENISYQCTVCNISFAGRPKLMAHLRIHSSDKRYRCNLCDKLFLYKNALKRHSNSHKSRTSLLRTPIRDKKFRCSVCQKSFGNGKSMNDHKRTHFKSSNLSCETCKEKVDENKKINQTSAHASRKKKNKACKKLDKSVDDQNENTVVSEGLSTELDNAVSQPAISPEVPLEYIEI